MTVPSSTYRLQLHPGFTFEDARALVDYLLDLGVGAIYASPVLDATPGSTHGYDTTDPRRARPSLGGEAGRRRLVEAVREAQIGLVVDIVPNHMSVEVPESNPWWYDVLKYGAASRYAQHFDIDWARKPLLLPFLSHEGAAADLVLEDDALVLDGTRYPIAPGTWGGTAQDVHERQHYRLVDWRRGNTELGYRRFFDITTLVGVRVERAEVFDDTHREVLRWVSSGDVTGLRIDHPDGLADPGGYLRRLREAAPQAWIVVEKILHPGEELPASWPVDGTTGYDALGEVSGVFIDPAGENGFAALARSLGVRTDHSAVEQEARRLVTDHILVAEVRRIADLVQDADSDAARDAVAETMIAFPVYRSYLPENAGSWAEAIDTARSRRPDLGPALAALDVQVRADPAGELATRIQQTSGMVVAKGTEDTALYRCTGFVALNEVGGSPGRFGLGPGDFHRLAADRQSGSPTTMTTLTTHDTKRSEDTRARMAVLAEIPEDFAVAVTRWTARCGIDEPALNLLAWQTLVGAWPISDERLCDYLLKAARESKLRTTWTEPDEAFERVIGAWPGQVRADVPVAGEVEQLVERVTIAGWSNALGQKLVQLTSPGVPDVYQGTELWDLSLVDPDNRRAVDFVTRRRLLAEIMAGVLPDVDESGAAKLLVVHRALALRRDRPELFDGYGPLWAQGTAAEHALAFSRSPNLVVVATRLPIALAAKGGWADTALPLADAGWTDVLTGASHDGGRVELATLLSRYPVALLVKRGR